jgi:hypothetical protein
MDRARIPVTTRWLLLALGKMPPGKRQPFDPVATWILAARPDLGPAVPAPAVLATLRARATLVDRMLDAELDDARDAGEMISLWTFGGGFDARWHRLAATLRDAVVEQVEVELPEVIAAKDALLARSPFAKAWASIRRRALPAEQWRVPAGEAGPGVRRLLLLEALAGRWDSDALWAQLDRLDDVPAGTRTIACLPGWAPDERVQWAARRLLQRGWRVLEDQRIAPRGRIVGYDGAEVCPASYPFRVVRLERVARA